MSKIFKKNIHSINDVTKSLNNKNIILIALIYFAVMILSPIMITRGKGVFPIIGIVLFLIGSISLIIFGIKVLKKNR